MEKTFKKAILTILGLVIVGSVVFILDASSDYIYALRSLYTPERNNTFFLQLAEYSRDNYYYIYKTKLTASLITILTAFALMKRAA